MSGYRYLGYKKGDLPITEIVQNEIFSLPMYPSLKPTDVEYISKKLKKIINSL